MSPQSASAGHIDMSAARSDRLTRESFGANFEQVSKALWCIAVGVLSDRSAAEDVVQESALIALERLGEFTPGTNFLAWMGQIVRLTALNEVRKRGRRRTFAADPVSIDGEARLASADRLSAGPAEQSDRTVTGSGELTVGQESFDDRLLTALRSLDDVARSCLMLRVVLDMPYDRIALALDIPQGTAMSHVHRSRLALRDRMTEAAGRADRSQGKECRP